MSVERLWNNSSQQLLSKTCWKIRSVIFVWKIDSFKIHLQFFYGVIVKKKKNMELSLAVIRVLHQRVKDLSC